jgi:hypothetical protein
MFIDEQLNVAQTLNLLKTPRHKIYNILNIVYYDFCYKVRLIYNHKNRDISMGSKTVIIKTNP